MNQYPVFFFCGGKDVDGNWHGGAIATLMDTVGAVAIYSVFNHVMKSMDFSISYYSTAKIQVSLRYYTNFFFKRELIGTCSINIGGDYMQEEVEINAKVLGNKGKLIQVMIEVRKKGNGDLIALAKQWMALKYFTVTTVSKL